MTWQGCRHQIERVEQRWRTPEGPAFRVRTDQGILFDIHYHELEDRWTVRPARSAGSSRANRS
ncbi:MAG: hypothetical protein ACP5JJ_13345 [Anaerolineae bacterium]